MEDVRGATRAAMENLVGLCIEERAELLLLAGDLFDGDWKDYSTGLFYTRQLARLREAGVRVATVRGNHDASSAISSHLRLPPNVHEFSARAPSTHVYDDLGVAVHGQSFPRREVTEDLARRYPDPIAGALNIGLLHTALSGSEHHEPYAPCSVGTLEAKGYSYWALGHIHQRQVVSAEPWIVFPGNLQGRHVRETGPKGATLVTVEGGAVQQVEHRALDVVRWETCDVDVSRLETVEDLLEVLSQRMAELVDAADGRLLALVITVYGASELHRKLLIAAEHWENEVRALALDVAVGRIWVHRIRWKTSSPRRAEGLANAGALGQVMRSFAELEQDGERRAALAEALRALESKLPPDLRLGPEPLRLTERAYVDSVLEDVRELVLGALLQSEEEP